MSGPWRKQARFQVWPWQVWDASRCVRQELRSGWRASENHQHIEDYMRASRKRNVTYYISMDLRKHLFSASVMNPCLLVPRKWWDLWQTREYRPHKGQPLGSHGKVGQRKGGRKDTGTKAPRAGNQMNRREWQPQAADLPLSGQRGKSFSIITFTYMRI